MGNDPFIDDCPIKPSIYSGFSMAMLNNQRVYLKVAGALRAAGQMTDTLLKRFILVEHPDGMIGKQLMLRFKSYWYCTAPIRQIQSHNLSRKVPWQIGDLV